MSSKPLEGVRILDMTMWWSGPICTSYLGALGAEVIKVESIQFPDGFRYTMSVPGDNWWELGPQFNTANLNKMGITLNLNDEEGIRLYKELVRECDVVIENFTPRVMENFNLSYEALREINQNIIMISMPAYGKTGPYKNQSGFAYTFEILSGIVQVNGYRDGNPMIVSGVADVIAGFHTAYALLSALEYREESGEGQYIEMAQVEACLNLMGQPIADYSMNGRNWGRVGNRHPGMAPHGLFPSKGENSWVSIAVTNEEDWHTFCRVIGQPDLALDERFKTAAARCENEDQLDAIVQEWTSGFTHYESSELLQEAGLAAGPVIEVDEMEEDPFLKDMFQEVSRDLTGTHPFPSWPVKFDGERLQHSSPAPKLGEHNEYVLKEILKLDESKIAELEKSKVIGTIPQGVS